MESSLKNSRIWHILTRNRTVFLASHTFIHKRNEPCPSAAVHHRSLACTHFSRLVEGRRLSWPGWLVTHRGGLSARRRSPIPIYKRKSTYSNFVDTPNAATVTPNHHRTVQGGQWDTLCYSRGSVNIICQNSRALPGEVAPWSKNFDERPHHRGADFYGEGGLM